MRSRRTLALLVLAALAILSIIGCRRRVYTLQEALAQPIAEPSGLPTFHIYRGVNGVSHVPPTSPCTWAQVAPVFPDDPPLYLPVSFLEGNGRFARYDVEAMRRCGFPSDSSWAGILRQALNQFARAPRMHENLFSHAAGASGQGDDRRRVLSAYGVLQTDVIDAGGPYAWYDFRTLVLPLVYRSDALMERVYTWALPHVTRVRDALPAADRRSYLEIARHAQAYLRTFDEQRELAYLHRLEQGQCAEPITEQAELEDLRAMASPGYPTSPCTYHFTLEGPDGRDNSFRKVEAWIFRRIHDGMPRARLQRYVDRVVELFES